MTLAELYASPIGTTFISLVKTTVFWADEYYRDLDYDVYQATHYERVSKAIKPTVFQAATEEEAMQKAEAHDRKRKEIRQKWRNSAKQRREISKR